MTRAYAQDPMGNGRDLPEDIQSVLIDRLRAHPTTLIFLALHQHEAVGIATCFVGLSTFAARPVVNIHIPRPLANTLTSSGLWPRPSAMTATPT